MLDHRDVLRLLLPHQPVKVRPHRMQSVLCRPVRYADLCREMPAAFREAGQEAGIIIVFTDEGDEQ
jgi:hypothetical protein